MKKLSTGKKQKLLNLISLIILVEFLLKIDNKIIQSFGIVLTPFIVVVGVLLIKGDQQNIG